MATTIVSSLGQSTLFVQAGAGASPGYGAIDLRRGGIGGVFQEGVMEATSFEVTQRAAGVNLSVDIGANVANAFTGVAAYVQGDSNTYQGGYACPPHSVAINEVIAAAHATNPRVDRVVLEIQDNTHDASGQNRFQVRVISGTATSGATLDNLTGAAAVPDNCLLLADVHVPATDTTISNSQIRDRRKWARGANSRSVLATSDVVISSTNWALVSSSLSPRIECSGVPVRVRFTAHVTDSSSAGGRWTAMVNGVGVDSSGSVSATSGGKGIYRHGPSEFGISFTWTFVPAAGSNIIAPASAIISTGSYSILSDADTPILWTVEEIARQNTANNVSTSG